MISTEQFMHVVRELGETGAQDIRWAESCQAPDSADAFALEAIFVICNSGMKNTVARGIYERVVGALHARTPVRLSFGHEGKAAAIERIWSERYVLHAQYLAAPDKLAFLESLPWIGAITKYHLAKNFGLPYAKPDVHLQRLATREHCTAQALCERLAAATGWGVSTVDTLLWRACANGIIDSRTGQIRGIQP